jgi:DNA-binding transcriptional LysR family regulator
MLEDFELFSSLVGPLSRPNAAIMSISQLAKRIRTGDDKVRRVLSRFEEQLRCRLVTTRDRRLVLTDAGIKLGGIAAQLQQLASGEQEHDEPELLTIDVERNLAEIVLPAVLPEFWSLWGDSVRVQIENFDAVTLRERLENGSAHLGLGWTTDNPSAGEERLRLAIRWVATFRGDVSVEVEQSLGFKKLAQFDRLFARNWEQLPAAVAKFVETVPVARRIECPSLCMARTLAARSGAAILPTLGNTDCCADSALSCVPLEGIGTTGISIFLPRRAAAVTEAAASLATMLRNLKQTLEAAPLEEAEAMTADELAELVH